MIASTRNAKRLRRLAVAAAVAVSGGMFAQSAGARMIGDPEPTDPPETTRPVYSPKPTPTYSPTPRPTATPVPAVTPILYVSDRTGNRELFRQSSDGTGTTRITNTSDAEQDPTWNANRSRIAYVGTDSGHPMVYVMSWNGSKYGNAKFVDSYAHDSDPTLNPTGTKVAFTRRVNGRRGIFVADLNTDNTPANVRALKLPDPYAEYFQPAWSPDGTKIAMTSTLENRANIWYMPSTGGALTRVSWDGGFSPSWSPDSKKIAFTNYIPGTYNMEIFWNNLGQADHPPFRVTLYGGDDWDATWSRDGQRIGFTSRRSGSPDIWTAKLDGSGLFRVTTNSANDFDPVWGTGS